MNRVRIVRARPPSCRLGPLGRVEIQSSNVAAARGRVAHPRQIQLTSLNKQLLLLMKILESVIKIVFKLTKIL